MNEAFDEMRLEMIQLQNEGESLAIENKKVKQDFLYMLKNFQDFMQTQETKRACMAARYKEKLKRLKMQRSFDESENTDRSNQQPDRIQEAIDKSQDIPKTLKRTKTVSGGLNAKTTPCKQDSSLNESLNLTVSQE
jgi:hypothetical protein